MNEVDVLPFSVDRALPESLTDQVVAGVTAAIETGMFARGTCLPSLRELADALGVSLIVVRHAYDRLVRDGRIVARHGVGFVVVAVETPLYRGRVLLVGFGAGENYLSCSCLDVLERRFADRQYLVTRVTVKRDAKTGEPDPILENALRQNYQLIVSLYDGPNTVARLVRESSPVVCLYNQHRPVGANVTPVFFHEGAALRDFAKACRAWGVRRVLQVLFHPTFANAQAEISGIGISVETLSVRSKYGRETISSLMQRTSRLFEIRLARGRAWLPDVIYFNDDYVATAATLALLKHGVRIPEDVRLAAWSNVGQGPELPVPFARIKFDGHVAGEKLFKAAWSVLQGRPFQADDVKTEFVDFG